MKILLVILGMLAWIGSCNEDKEIVVADTVEADGKWVNMLATDGCAWHFEVMNKDSSFTSYAAEDGSLKIIEEALGKSESSYSFTDVRIKYSLTGGEKNVQCGWGATATYPAIKIYSISKR